jgi:1-phosphatidylinositol phosphodiesterase
MVSSYRSLFDVCLEQSYWQDIALLSNNAQLDDVFWGLYHWLDSHPTETVFVSLKVDNGSTTTDLQNTVRGLVTGNPGSNYWYQPLTPVSVM